jgi:hypothetical protein
MEHLGVEGAMLAALRAIPLPPKPKNVKGEQEGLVRDFSIADNGEP